MVYPCVIYVFLQFFLMTLGSTENIPSELEGYEKSSINFDRPTVQEINHPTFFLHKSTSGEGDEIFINDHDTLQQTPGKVLGPSITRKKNAQSSNPALKKYIDGHQNVKKTVKKRHAKDSENHQFKIESDNSNKESLKTDDKFNRETRNMEKTNIIEQHLPRDKTTSTLIPETQDKKKGRKHFGEMNNLSSETAQATRSQVLISGQIPAAQIEVNSSSADGNSYVDTELFLESSDASATTTQEDLLDERDSPFNGSGKATLDCRCGVVDPKDRIVGGIFATILQHPWMVQLMIAKSNIAFCAGSLINDLYVLTAAHCVEDTQPSEIVVRLGHTGPKSVGFKVGVEAIKPHTRYQADNISFYDIALIKLKRRVTFAKRVWPICVWKKASYDKDLGTITGWGAVSESGPQSLTLKKASVTISEFIQCRQISDYPPEALHFRILCARRSNTDTCQGDSGGPMTSFNGVRRYQVGIVSWGFGCARNRFPGIYTRVASYIGWIRQMTRDGRYCAQ